jgi:hypothetical protein
MINPPKYRRVSPDWVNRITRWKPCFAVVYELVMNPKPTGLCQISGIAVYSLNGYFLFSRRVVLAMSVGELPPRLHGPMNALNNFKYFPL